MQFIHRLILILLFSNKIVAQDDPSTWPAPSAELIKSGFYTKERLYKYLEWKESTLPDLFLLYNPNEIKHYELTWGKGNFQHRFQTINFPLEFVIDHQHSRKRFAEIKSLSIHAVDTIKLTEPAILIKSLNETWTRREQICFKLENQYRDFYIVWVDKPKESCRLFKVTYCRCEFDE